MGGFRRTGRLAPLSLRALGFPVRCSGVYSRFAQDCGLLRSLVRYSGTQGSFHSCGAGSVSSSGPGKRRAGCYPNQLRQGRNETILHWSCCSWIPHAVAYRKHIRSRGESQSTLACVEDEFYAWNRLNSRLRNSSTCRQRPFRRTEYRPKPARHAKSAADLPQANAILRRDGTSVDTLALRVCQPR